MPTLGQRRDSGAYGFSDFSSPAKSGDNDEEEFGFPDSTAGSHDAAASPIKWETSQAPNGKTYWFNRATGESRWTAPPSSNTLSPPVQRMYYLLLRHYLFTHIRTAFATRTAAMMWEQRDSAACPPARQGHLHAVNLWRLLGQRVALAVAVKRRGKKKEKHCAGT